MHCIPLYLTGNRPRTDTPSQGWPTPWEPLASVNTVLGLETHWAEMQPKEWKRLE